MTGISRLIALAILLFTLVFNLVSYFPETQILADPNDNIFQYSLVRRTDWIWEQYGCPISLSCFPHLVDHLVPTWAEGYPLPFYYSHIPQILIVSSYRLFFSPLSSLFSASFSLYSYYNWTKYLLFAFFPLSVFWALRVVGFPLIISSISAFFAAQISTDGLYGVDPSSFLWRGYGLTSQLYAQFFFPLSLAYSFRTFSSASRHSRSLFLSILFLTLTTVGHLGMGILGMLSLVPFLFFDLNITRLKQRFLTFLLLSGSVILLLSYWIFPILMLNSYHMVSFWDPLWKFHSYGWYEATRQLFSGELFDWGRYPIVTSLVFIGFFSLLSFPSRFPLALLFSVFFLLFFGRTTWGGFIDLIVGMQDFHQHRFIVGVHIAGLFLLPAGLQTIYRALETLPDRIRRVFSFFPDIAPFFVQSVTPSLFSLIVLSLALLSVGQTLGYARLNSRWIYEANTAYTSGQEAFSQLTAHLRRLPAGRIYAGRPGNWGKSLRIGSTQLYMALGKEGFDISQFLPETWSPLSENEQNFDERIWEDYDLLNIRAVVSDKNYDFSDRLAHTATYGPFLLFTVPTSGWFDVVTSPMSVSSDKTNFINIVHLWHRSYPRRWSMHPLISVAPRPSLPFPVSSQIRMVDEVSYISSVPDQPDSLLKEGGRKNIFSDFPFVFPDATPSGRITREDIHRQTYSATIWVPDDCPSCMVLFKMSFHPNWKATVDGVSVQTYAVFPFYLAVPILPGTHTVSFTYHPNSLKLLLLAGEFVGMLLFFFLWIRKNPRRFFRRLGPVSK